MRKNMSRGQKILLTNNTILPFTSGAIVQALLYILLRSKL